MILPVRPQIPSQVRLADRLQAEPELQTWVQPGPEPLLQLRLPLGRATMPKAERERLVPLRPAHLLQGSPGPGEDGLPVGPHEHDEDDVVHQEEHNWNRQKEP